MIRAIVAMDEQRGIAVPNNPPWNMPWHIPADLKHFRNLTEGSTVLMGRNTYELFNSPLPERRNVVASGGSLALRSGFELVADVDTYVQECTEDVWIIGGAKLYESTLQYCDEIYVTQVVGSFACNRFFPEFESTFTKTEQGEIQHDNGYDFRFVVYKKNR